MDATITVYEPDEEAIRALRDARLTERQLQGLAACGSIPARALLARRRRFIDASVRS